MDIQVAGYGIICAIGNDASAVLKSLKEGKTGIGPMHHLQSSHKELPVGEVKLSNEEMMRMLGQDEKAIISRTALLGAIAIRQAIEDANLELKGKRIALISGTTVAGMDVTECALKQSSLSSLLKERSNEQFLPIERDLEEALRKHDCGSSTCEMAALAGLKEAEVCTISTACSSAANAIILGSEMLKAGEADIVIAGGTEALSLFHLNGFNSLMILDREQCRPFDKTRAGLNLGEGAAFVVLNAPSPLCLLGSATVSQKRENLAAMKHSPKGGAGRGPYILGYANRCDAFHQTASSENGEGAFLAMSDALQMAGLKPQDIRYINAHGTGTPNNDSSESAAIRRVFGEHIPPVSSTKGFTGHTTSASGAIETVACILALQNNFLPVNLGWKEQDEACITPAHSPLPLLGGAVLCNSFGFGGNDSALIIGISPNPSKGEEKHQDAETCILAEAVVDDAEQLGELREYVSAGEARRMARLMKAATITSLKALKEAGVETPDAIITATAFGMLETSQKFLADMLENGEEMLSPTLFMQSTHNTLSSAIAIRTKCRGYNMTYSQGKSSLRWALRDARRLIATGKARTVLVGLHDEATPLVQAFCRNTGRPVPPEIYSRSIVLQASGQA